MFKLVPLIIVLNTFVILWILGKLLSRIASRSQDRREAKTRGSRLFPHLHVVGLNDIGLAELKSFIETKDINELCIFLALKKPSFIELDNYLDSLRDKFHTVLNQPLHQASDIERITAVSVIDINRTPEGYDFTRLTKAELRALLEFDPKKRRLINHEFMARFGENRFMENFNVYRELSSSVPVTLIVAKDEPKRRPLETLVKTGIALQGRKIPLRDRLSVLKYNQLREMAKELKLDKEFKRRADATAALSEIPGSAILLAMLVNIDDIFMIKPEPIDCEAVENEWAVIKSYAKLLCS